MGVVRNDWESAKPFLAGFGTFIGLFAVSGFLALLNGIHNMRNPNTLLLPVVTLLPAVISCTMLLKSHRKNRTRMSLALFVASALAVPCAIGLAIAGYYAEF